MIRLSLSWFISAGTHLRKVAQLEVFPQKLSIVTKSLRN